MRTRSHSCSALKPAAFNNQTLLESKWPFTPVKCPTAIIDSIVKETSIADDDWSPTKPTRVSLSSESEPPSPSISSMQAMISDIMGQYKSALENLTTEVTNLRSELANQNQTSKNSLKLFKQQQLKQNQQFEQQLKDQQQHQQKQQHQLRNQMTQQMEKHLLNISSADTPKIDIQYETIEFKNQPALSKAKKNECSNIENTQSSVPMSSSNIQQNILQADVLLSKARTISPPSEKPMEQKQPKQKEQQNRKTNRKTVMIFGSSIVRHVNGGKITRKTKVNTKVNCYPGATVEEIEEHIDVRLKYAKQLPGTVILHGGGNNLANGDKIETIIDAYTKLALKLKSKGITNIAISGVTGRDNLKNEIPKLNQALRDMCKKFDLNYINNSFITFRYHLCWDKIHLNFDGVDQMEKNFSKYLREMYEEKK